MWDIELQDPDTQIQLYEDVLERKRSIESLHSIVPHDD